MLFKTLFRWYIPASNVDWSSDNLSSTCRISPHQCLPLLLNKPLKNQTIIDIAILLSGCTDHRQPPQVLNWEIWQHPSVSHHRLTHMNPETLNPSSPKAGCCSNRCNRMLAVEGFKTHQKRKQEENKYATTIWETGSPLLQCFLLGGFRWIYLRLHLPEAVWLFWKWVSVGSKSFTNFCDFGACATSGKKHHKYNLLNLLHRYVCNHQW